MSRLSKDLGARVLARGMMPIDRSRALPAWLAEKLPKESG
jgi:hypothetical protein